MLARMLVTKLLSVNSGDPEDERRRKLLSVLLLGFVVVCLLTLILVTVATLTGTAGNPLEVQLLYIGGFVALASNTVIYFINRYGNGPLASVLFLLFFIAIAFVSDEPEQVVAGRSLFLFVLPIFMASVLVRPYASFVFAGIVSVSVALLGIRVNIVPNMASTSGFFMMALVSWLAARSLERALMELRAINRELDQRVEQRTRDLSAALTRVQAESSKSQAILESIADGVIVFDNLGKAIVANPSVSQLLGCSAESIVNRDIQALMSENVSPADRELVARSLQDEVSHGSGVKFRWGQKTLSASFAAVHGATAKSVGHVMVCRDFTREAELDRMKSAFLSMASHELRTPLNAILGYSDMLQEGVYGSLNDDQQRTNARIMANAKRMLGLVNNLLDQAQIEAGKLSLHIDSFQLQDLIEDLKMTTLVLGENKGLKLTYEVDSDVPATLISDAQRLHQIILNLVGNAIKFTKKGGILVHIALADKTHWKIIVSDTGVGIPPEAQAYIFEPFRQVDDSVTRENTGSGLGLSIVKQLTNLLGGEIRLESVVDQGSTFTITLPLQPIQEAVV